MGDPGLAPALHSPPSLPALRGPAASGPGSLHLCPARPTAHARFVLGIPSSRSFSSWLPPALLIPASLLVPLPPPGPTWRASPPLSSFCSLLSSRSEVSISTSGVARAPGSPAACLMSGYHSSTPCPKPLTFPGFHFPMALLLKVSAFDHDTPILLITKVKTLPM